MAIWQRGRQSDENSYRLARPSRSRPADAVRRFVVSPWAVRPRLQYRRANSSELAVWLVVFCPEGRGTGHFHAQRPSTSIRGNPRLVVWSCDLPNALSTSSIHVRAGKRLDGNELFSPDRCLRYDEWIPRANAAR